MIFDPMAYAKHLPLIKNERMGLQRYWIVPPWRNPDSVGAQTCTGYRSQNVFVSLLLTSLSVHHRTTGVLTIYSTHLLTPHLPTNQTHDMYDAFRLQICVFSFAAKKVKDGRWAYTEIPNVKEDNPGLLESDVYGKLRSPWNTNDRP